MTISDYSLIDLPGKATLVSIGSTVAQGMSLCVRIKN
jgi:hypothetical protein